MLDPSAEEHVENEIARQRVIDGVLASHSGRPASQVREELAARLEDAGMTGLPESWLTSVAADLSLGHVYVVSRRTRAVVVEDADHEVPQE